MKWTRFLILTLRSLVIIIIQFLLVPVEFATTTTRNPPRCEDPLMVMFLCMFGAAIFFEQWWRHAPPFQNLYAVATTCNEATLFRLHPLCRFPYHFFWTLKRCPLVSPARKGRSSTSDVPSMLWCWLWTFGGLTSSLWMLRWWGGLLPGNNGSFTTGLLVSLGWMAPDNWLRWFRGAEECLNYVHALVSYRKHSPLLGQVLITTLALFLEEKYQ